MLVVGSFELIEEFGRSCRPVTSSRIREIAPQLHAKFRFHSPVPSTHALELASSMWNSLMSPPTRGLLVSSKEANASTRFAFFSVSMLTSSPCRYFHV